MTCSHESSAASCLNATDRDWRASGCKGSESRPRNKAGTGNGGGALPEGSVVADADEELGAGAKYGPRLLLRAQLIPDALYEAELSQFGYFHALDYTFRLRWPSTK